MVKIQTLHEAKKKVVEIRLRNCQGHIRKAASTLNVSRDTIDRYRIELIIDYRKSKRGVPAWLKGVKANETNGD